MLWIYCLVLGYVLFEIVWVKHPRMTRQIKLMTRVCFGIVALMFFKQWI